MPKWLRALLAGYGAKKLGGGCFSTILIFILIYYALGYCNAPSTRRTELNHHQRQEVAIIPSMDSVQTFLAK
jgi:hypothetical protein